MKPLTIHTKPKGMQQYTPTTRASNELRASNFIKIVLILLGVR